MTEWKSWCRLCASFEETFQIESELNEVLEQAFEIPAFSLVCHNCNAFVQEFYNFRNRTRDVKQIFEELEKRDKNLEHFVLSLRQAYDLPLPDNIEIVVEQATGMDEVLEEAEVYQSDIETNEMEFSYGMETENDPTQSENVVYTEDIVAEGEETAEYEYEEYPEESNVSQELMDQDQMKDDQETDEISKHFVFNCHICNQQFPKMYYLTTHSRTVHNCLPRVECSCGKFIGSTKVLEFHFNNHIKEGAAFRCQECDKVYKTEANFNSHMKTMHSNGEDSHKFQCECGKTFKEARHLETHKNTHLPDELKFIHACDQCNKKYSSIFSLRHHVKHVHVKEPTFECPHCKRMFSRKANLDSHINHVHTHERNFECDICGLKLKTKGILKNHKKLHSTDPEDFHTCETCQRRFKTRNQLTNHKVCHIPDKFFKCASCPAEYKRSKELLVHMRTVHLEETNFPCSWCPETFYNNVSLRKHKLKSHIDMLKNEQS